MSDKVETAYGAEQIQVLDGLEHIRKRPGMYISSTDEKGLHHLVSEVVDNSIDEALAGYCTRVEVTVNADGSCTIIDNGRGIPTAIHPKEGISTVEVVFTKVNAGGKFGGDSGYKVSSGLHGVGVKAVNALSEWLEVEVYQNGHIYKQVYNRGVAQRPLAIIGDTDRTGTKVTFYPDSEIFETIVFKYETLKIRLKELAFLNKGLTITLEDKREGKERHDEIWAAIDAGLMVGYDDGTFRPAQTITRAETVYLLWELEDNIQSATASTLADVGGRWYEDAAAWAESVGLVTGIRNDDGTLSFRGANELTRVQVAALLYKYAGLIGLDTSVEGELTATDASSVKSWGVDATNWCLENGILSADENGAVNPDAPVTRSKMAVALTAFSALLPETDAAE